MLLEMCDCVRGGGGGGGGGGGSACRAFFVLYLKCNVHYTESSFMMQAYSLKWTLNRRDSPLDSRDWGWLELENTPKDGKSVYQHLDGNIGVCCGPQLSTVYLSQQLPFHAHCLRVSNLH